jgi:hypothetical protein
MRHPRTLTAVTAAAALLAAAPAALAKTIDVGNSSGNPTMNICPYLVDCTYLSYEHNKPIDVVKRTGTIVDWSLNAGSINGQVQLRVLRRVAGGKLKAVGSSAIETVSIGGLNTFSAHIKVKRGDILGLSNSSSGIYMANAGADDSVRYFDTTFAAGSTGKPNQSSPRLRLLLSAHVKV